MPGTARRSATLLPLLLLLLAPTGCGSGTAGSVGDRTSGSAAASGSSDSSASASPAPGAATSPAGPAGPAAPATTVPAELPLTEGMPANDSGEPIAVGHRGVGMRMLDLCGTRPLRGLDTTDRLTATSSGPEYSSTRDLMVFATAGESDALAAEVVAAARACPEEDSGPGSRTLTEVRASSVGPAAATVVHTYATGDQVGVGAEIIEVVPVGTALLVTSAYAEWTPGPVLDDGIAQGLQALAPVLDAMSVFGEPAQGATVPADFPLDVDLPADDGDHTIVPPSPDADGVGEVEVCGTGVWPVGPTQSRLATTAHGPERVDARELVVLADAEAAATVLPRVRSVVEACVDAPAHQVWTLHEADTGHDSLTFSLTWDDGPGASVFQLTRVGRALLLTHAYGEGMLDSLGPTLRERSALTRAIAPAMCTFTADGC